MDRNWQIQSLVYLSVCLMFCIILPVPILAQLKASSDGTLDVSTASGGVSYNYPISSQTISGHPLNVELNYAGAVTFTSFYDYAPINEPECPNCDGWVKFNRTHPAWLIGVNGFAVQALSSKNSFINDVHSSFTASSYREGDLLWMIEGYDYNNRMKRLEGAYDQDVIKILMSSGSLLELRNANQVRDIVSGQEAKLYTGQYYTASVNDGGFAVVEFDSTTYWPSYIKEHAAPAYPERYRNVPRILRYYRGDGLEYVFREHVAAYGVQFKSKGTTSGTLETHDLSDAISPTIFYLEEIRSEARTIASFKRSRHYPSETNIDNEHFIDITRGRALLTEFTGHRFTYSEKAITIEALGRTIVARCLRKEEGFGAGQPLMDSSNVVEGFAISEMDLWSRDWATWATPDTWGQLGFIKDITDAEERKTTFDYKWYSSEHSGFGFPFNGTSRSVYLTKLRLTSIVEPTKKYTIDYYIGDGIVQRDSLFNIGDGIDYDFTSTVKETRKYSLLDTLQNVTKYSFVFNPDTSYDRKVTVQLIDTISHSRTSTDAYFTFYKEDPYKNNPQQAYYAPELSYPALRHIEKRVGDMTTRIYNEYSNSFSGGSRMMYVPVYSKIILQQSGGQATVQSHTNFDYEFTTMNSFGGNTSLAALFGKSVSKRTAYTHNPNPAAGPDSILNVLTSHFTYLPLSSTTISRTDSTWNDLQSKSYSRSLWSRGIEASANFFNTVTVTNKPITIPPRWNLPVKSFLLTFGGDTLSGIINRFNTTFSTSPTVPYGSLIADTIVGRGSNVRLMGNKYHYTGGWYRNLLTSIESPNGSQSFLYYDYAKVPGGTDYPIGQKLRNDNSVINRKLYHIYHEFDIPLAGQTKIRRYNSSGLLETDVLTSYQELGHYGKTTASIDANGWYAANEYDKNGRLLTVWHPYDFPAGEETPSSTATDGCASLIKNETENYERHDTLRYPIVTTWPRDPDISVGPPLKKGNTDHRLIASSTPGMARTTGDATYQPSSEIVTTHSQTAKLTYESSSDDAIHTGVNIEAASLKLFVTNISAPECLTLEVGLNKFGYSRRYVIGCPEIETMTGPVLPLTQESFPFFNIDLMPVVDSIKAMPEGDSLVFEINVISGQGLVEFATLADDIAPCIAIRAKFPDQNKDYTFAYYYDDDKLTYGFIAKVDDTLHTTTKGWSRTYAFEDGRYSAGVGFAGIDNRTDKFHLYIGSPASPTRIDTLSTTYGGFNQPLMYRNQVGSTVQIIRSNGGTTDTTINADGSRTISIYQIDSPTFFGFTNAAYFGGCTKLTSTNEKGVKSVKYFDGLGQLRREIKDEGGLNLTIRYEYDPVTHELTHVFNPKGDSTKYWYDTFGNLKYVWQSDVGFVSNSYNKYGQLRYSQDQLQADSNKLSYFQYDDLGRVVVTGEARITGSPTTPGDPNRGGSLNRLTDAVSGDGLKAGGVSTIETANITLWQPLNMVPLRIQPTFSWPQLDSTQSIPTYTVYPDEATPKGPYLTHTTKYFEPAWTITASTTDFENIAKYPEFVLNAVSYDKMPDRAGAVWTSLVANSVWNAAAPKTEVRNLKGQVAASAYRDNSGQPFHYVVMSYDERGRVEALLRHTENLGYDAVYYTYNSMNQVLTVRAVDPLRQYITWYGYDKNGRPDTVWTTLTKSGTGLGLGNPTYPALMPTRPTTADIVYSYDRRGAIDSICYIATNLTTKYKYGTRGWLDTMVAERNYTQLFTTAFDRDQTGNIEQQVSKHAGQSQRTQDYVYDNAERLKDWTTGGATTTYNYDAVGNRTTVVEGLTTTNYTYGTANKSNRLTSVAKGTDITNFTYNNNGGVSRRQKYTGVTETLREDFTYNVMGFVDRYAKHEFTTMTSCSSSSESVRASTWDWRYRYSASGGREQKRLYYSPEGDSCGKTHLWEYYLLGAEGEQLVVYRGRQTAAATAGFASGRRTYMYAVGYNTYTSDGLTLTTAPDSTKTTNVTDNLGSTRVRASSLGTNEGFDYKPFGGMLWSSTGGETRYGFIGKTKDLESQLGDFGARKYDDDIGRFLSVDAYWSAFPGHNPYHYSYNSPLKYKDPSGYFTLVILEFNNITISINFELDGILDWLDGIAGGGGDPERGGMTQFYTDTKKAEAAAQQYIDEQSKNPLSAHFDLNSVKNESVYTEGEDSEWTPPSREYSPRETVSPEPMQISLNKASTAGNMLVQSASVGDDIGKYLKDKVKEVKKELVDEIKEQIKEVEHTVEDGRKLYDSFEDKYKAIKALNEILASCKADKPTDFGKLQFVKPGGDKQAFIDFMKLANPKTIIYSEKNATAQLIGYPGTYINLHYSTRPGQYNGFATLQLQLPIVVKIRYELK